MDLSKVYDCVTHNLLIAKLECYDVDKASLSLLLDYLTRRKQRTRIGSSFSSCCSIKTGVPQGSINGSLIFNIFMDDLIFFHIKSEVCNLTYDNTLLSDDKNSDHVFFNLNSDLNNVMDWHKISSLKANSGKFQFIVMGASKNDCFSLNVARKVISFSSEVKLLGIRIDNELKFRKHINRLILMKAPYKLHAL